MKRWQFILLLLFFSSSQNFLILQYLTGVNGKVFAQEGQAGMEKWDSPASSPEEIARRIEIVVKNRTGGRYHPSELIVTYMPREKKIRIDRPDGNTLLISPEHAALFLESPQGREYRELFAPAIEEAGHDGGLKTGKVAGTVGRGGTVTGKKSEQPKKREIVETSYGRLDAVEWRNYLLQLARNLDKRIVKNLRPEEREYCAKYYGLPESQLKLVPAIVADVLDDFYAFRFPEVTENMVERSGNNIIIHTPLGKIIEGVEDMRIFVLHERGGDYRRVIGPFVGLPRDVSKGAEALLETSEAASKGVEGLAGTVAPVIGENRLKALDEAEISRRAARTLSKVPASAEIRSTLRSADANEPF